MGGKRLVEWRPSGVDHVRELALANTAKGPLIVAAWFNERIGTLDVITNEAVIHTTKGGHITAGCLTECEGQSVFVAATEDLRLMICELPSLRVVTVRNRATAAPIYALRVVNVGTSRVLVSGGDSIRMPHVHYRFTAS